jgi:peptidoglycan hydrolase-like protein with peptidoglycan-binding domain
VAGSISKFCEVMRKACEDWSLGYDQNQRWNIKDGGECDCSSLVIWALKQAGFDTGSASYTGDMSSNLTKRGWTRIPYRGLWQVKAGDILLNDTYHVAAVISGSGATARLAQASIDERGRATGGASGDQSGHETNVRQVYDYSHGWDCILRYSGADSGADSGQGGVTTQKLVVDGYLGPQSVAEWQRQCGTTVDGVVSGQSWECELAYPRLTSVSFDGNGSDLMRKVQKTIGVPSPSGIISYGTVGTLQGWLMLRGYSCAADNAGVLGEATAKAVQKSLNAGVWK